MKKIWKAGIVIVVMSLFAANAAYAEPAHNVILFVPDGLRAGIVDAKIAPTFNEVRTRGVNFQNPHSLFPTFTTPNASAMATGHYLGDTGDFSNTIYTGFATTSADGSVTPFLENDAVLDEVDDHFAGNYLDEETVLSAARNAGFLTAAVGKLGPAAIQAVPDLHNTQTIVIDDATGGKAGIALSDDIIAALQQAGLPTTAPGRGDNKNAGDIKDPGTLVANIEQQKYFVDVATKVILPRFKEAGKPFMLVFWSRDPDGTQHNQGDSPNALTPGINGPTSMAAIRNADDNLAQIMAALKALGLDKTTDIVISADHGFSTVAKQSDTSNAAKGAYADTPAGQLPAGFVALDLAQALGLPLIDPDAKNTMLNAAQFPTQHPKKGNALLGYNATAPDVVVAANGGSDLIYLPQANAQELAPKVVEALLAQDYVSGIFVDDVLGDIPGTLPLSAINLKGSALTPVPAIVVNFRSFDTGCGQPLLCAVEIADSNLQQGHGMHGNFSRADTANFMAAIGPDFRKGYVDAAPASNADVGETLAYLLHLDVPHHGTLIGRVLSEAFINGKPVIAKKQTRISTPASNGAQTILQEQVVGSTLYFDAAGFAGKTVGLRRSEE